MRNKTNNSKNQIIISSYGNGIAVGIEGEKDFIETSFNLFFNYGAVSKNGELHMESETFGYFLSSEEKVKSAISVSELCRMVSSGESKKYKENSESFLSFCDSIAEEKFNSYKKENFMGFNLGETYFVSSYGHSGFKQKLEEDFHFDQVAQKALSQPARIAE